MGENIKKSIVKKIVTVVVAWLLSFFLVLFTIFGVLGYTVANQSFMNQQVHKSGFVALAMEQLNENYKSYGIVGNIPESVMTGIITEDRIRNDMLRAVKGLYAGDRRLIAHPEVAQAVQEAIAANLQERKITITDEIQTAIQDMANGCQADYDSYVQIVIAPYLARFMPKLSKVIFGGMVGVGMLAALSIAVLFGLTHKGTERARWCMYAFLSAGLFSGLLPIVFNRFIQMQYLNLKPETLKLLITSYTHDAVSVFYIAVVVHIAMAAVLLFVLRRVKQRNFNQ